MYRKKSRVIRRKRGRPSLCIALHAFYATRAVCTVSHTLSQRAFEYSLRYSLEDRVRGSEGHRVLRRFRGTPLCEIVLGILLAQADLRIVQ